MNVRELIQVLEVMDGDMPVVLSSDAEGNRLSELVGSNIEYTEADADGWEVEWSDEEYGTPTLILWPVN